MNHIVLKPDKRFKLGNIKRVGNKLRGHPETLDMKRYYYGMLAMNLNPPIVVSHELGEAIKKMGF